MRPVQAQGTKVVSRQSFIVTTIQQISATLDWTFTHIHVHTSTHARTHMHIRTRCPSLLSGMDLTGIIQNSNLKKNKKYSFNIDNNAWNISFGMKITAGSEMQLSDNILYLSPCCHIQHWLHSSMLYQSHVPWLLQVLMLCWGVAEVSRARKR